MLKTPEQKRVIRLKQHMMKKGIVGLLVTRREDVRYLSGFTGSAGSVLIPAQGKPWIITDFRYKLQVNAQTSGLNILIQKTDFFSTLRELAETLNIEQLWFDETALTVAELKKIKRHGIAMKASPDIVGPLRRLKDDGEIRSIRLAIARAEESFRELKQSIKPGVTERELAFRLDMLMKEKGSRKVAFDTIVASGPNGAMPHATVTNRKIKNGDFVTFDFGAEADGYFSDITRTICLGRPSPRQREIHALVSVAQAAAMESVRPGISCKSVDSAAREIIDEAGYAKNFGHGTGHGVGLMVHERPTVSYLSKDCVEEGMVFTVEPGVYIPGWGGVRIEDMVFVTEKKPKVLTTLPRCFEL